MLKIFTDLVQKYKLYIKYLIAGGTASFVNLALLFCFTHYIGFHYLVSATLAFIVAFFVSFYLQKFWTFRDNSRNEISKQGGKYLVTGLINLAINSVLMYVFVDIFHIWYMYSQVLAALLIACESFLIYKFLIFNKEAGKILTDGTSSTG
jgi:putative flippase GtrA